VFNAEVCRGARARVKAMDSITQLSAQDAGCIVVSGSHGGSSSAQFALAHPVLAVFFNDAGVGKDDAGIAALTILQARGIAAGVVSHDSARIGDARDAWEHGVISRVNDAASRLGLVPGVPLRAALQALAS
jgi:hypothetical protein